jgi:hypothetical protein
MSAELERIIERVWTLAGCVAELRWAAGRPLTQEDILAGLLAPPGQPWGFARPRRADLARFRDELLEIAAKLEQQHGALVRELASWRPIKLEHRPEALAANIGPPAYRIELDLDKIRALGTEEDEP